MNTATPVAILLILIGAAMIADYNGIPFLLPLSCIIFAIYIRRKNIKNGSNKKEIYIHNIVLLIFTGFLILDVAETAHININWIAAGCILFGAGAYSGLIMATIIKKKYVESIGYLVPTMIIGMSDWDIFIGICAVAYSLGFLEVMSMLGITEK